MAFCQPCQTIIVHYIACGASEQHQEECVVPNCCQQLSQPILWIVHVSVTLEVIASTGACVLMDEISRLRLSTLTHPTPSHLPILLHGQYMILQL